MNYISSKMSFRTHISTIVFSEILFRKMYSRFADDPIAKAAYLEALDKYLVPKMQEINRRLAIEAINRESQKNEFLDAAAASTKREQTPTATGRSRIDEKAPASLAVGNTKSAAANKTSGAGAAAGAAAAAAIAAAESLALLPPHNPAQPPAPLVRELIDLYRSNRLLERLETFLLAVLSFDELDSDWLLGLCRKFALHDALLYIFNSARLDYIGPFRELCGNLEVALNAQLSSGVGGGPPTLLSPASSSSSQQAANRSTIIPTAIARGAKRTDFLNESISSTASSSSSTSIRLFCRKHL